MIDWISLIVGLILGFIIGAVSDSKGSNKTFLEQLNLVKDSMHKNNKFYASIFVSGEESNDGDEEDLSLPLQSDSWRNN